MCGKAVQGVGQLYVIATPIGNLSDLSPRAESLLREVPHVAAEDTRHSRPLLRNIGSSAELVSLHEHNEAGRVTTLLRWLNAGEDVALISDAGTPLISDPGYRLVSAVREAGIDVVAVPGPCAAVAALSIAGLPTDRFSFAGFLPAKSNSRVTELAKIRATGGCWVLYESGRRLRASVADMVGTWPAESRLFIGRELTKQFEESVLLPLGDAAAWIAESSDRLRGEFVLVAHLPEPDAGMRRDLGLDDVLDALRDQVPASTAARIAAGLFGLKRRDVYQRILEVSSDDSNAVDSDVGDAGDESETSGA